MAETWEASNHCWGCGRYKIYSRPPTWKHEHFCESDSRGTLVEIEAFIKADTIPPCCVKRNVDGSEKELR
jgi:hypothetical protein